MSVSVTRETETKMVEVTTEVKKYNVSLTEGEARVVRALLGRVAGMSSKKEVFYTGRLFSEISRALADEGAITRYGVDLEMVDMGGERIPTIFIREENE